MTTMTKETRGAATEARAREKQATIASVSQQDFTSRGPTASSTFRRVPRMSPALSSSSRRAATPSTSATTAVFRLRFPREIAEAIIQDLEQHGIFVCAAERPTEAELASARELRDTWYRQLIAEADEMWARDHSYS
jgi:hypothetical protein